LLNLLSINKGISKTKILFFLFKKVIISFLTRGWIIDSSGLSLLFFLSIIIFI